MYCTKIAVKSCFPIIHHTWKSLNRTILFISVCKTKVAHGSDESHEVTSNNDLISSKFCTITKK